MYAIVSRCVQIIAIESLLWELEQDRLAASLIPLLPSLSMLPAFSLLWKHAINSKPFCDLLSLKRLFISLYLWCWIKYKFGNK